MRAEVALLSRNVRIVGFEQDNDWGCQVITSDAFDWDTFRIGFTTLSGVEVVGCSQKDANRAALRFEQAKAGVSVVENCAVHDGLAWGINIKSSKNVWLRNTIVANMVQIGVNV